jgi:hypothetical protein
MRQIAFRAEDEVAERLDAVAAAMQSQDPEYMGTEVSRSAVLRTLVLRGLLSTELQYGIAHSSSEDASYQVYKFWKRRLDEMQDELRELALLIHGWEEGRVAEDRQVSIEGAVLDAGEARKRELMKELKRHGVEVHDPATEIKKER